uniref:Uncharacterized protein n=1 Tax=Chenopodium quinoa TaxID=63459 RepID=A0A803LHR6_CHEQI
MAAPPPPPPQLPQPRNYPPPTVNPLPAPDPSTEILRQYVDCLIRNTNLEAAVLENPKNYGLLSQLHKLNEERQRLAQKLVSYPIVTVTNYSEFSVFLEDVELPMDTKIWVHEITSPRSVACIHDRHEESRRGRRILFASELTAEEIAGDRDQLFNSKNPNYSSDSS